MRLPRQLLNPKQAQGSILQPLLTSLRVGMVELRMQNKDDAASASVEILDKPVLRAPPSQPFLSYVGRFLFRYEITWSFLILHESRGFTDFATS